MLIATLKKNIRQGSESDSEIEVFLNLCGGYYSDKNGLSTTDGDIYVLTNDIFLNLVGTLCAGKPHLK